MTELESIKRELAELKDAYTKQTKTLNDLLLNLDFDNMPEVKRSISKYVSDTNQSLASIMTAVDANGAAIEQTAQKVTSLEGDVESVTEATTQISQSVTDSNAKIALLVKTKTTESGETISYVDGGVIIEAINDDESQVTISGDKINISGIANFVTKEELANGGSGTIIDGSLIKTDSIEVNQIKKTTTSVDQQDFFGVEFNDNIQIRKVSPNINFFDLPMTGEFGTAYSSLGYQRITMSGLTQTVMRALMMQSLSPIWIISTNSDIRIGAGVSSLSATTYNGNILLYGSGLYFNGRQLA